MAYVDEGGRPGIAASSGIGEPGTNSDSYGSVSAWHFFYGKLAARRCGKCGRPSEVLAKLDKEHWLHINKKEKLAEGPDATMTDENEERMKIGDLSIIMSTNI